MPYKTNDRWKTGSNLEQIDILLMQGNTILTPNDGNELTFAAAQSSVKGVPVDDYTTGDFTQAVEDDVEFKYVGAEVRDIIFEMSGAITLDAPGATEIMEVTLARNAMALPGVAYSYNGIKTGTVYSLEFSLSVYIRLQPNDILDLAMAVDNTGDLTLTDYFMRTTPQW